MDLILAQARLGDEKVKDGWDVLFGLAGLVKSVKGFDPDLHVRQPFIIDALKSKEFKVGPSRSLTSSHLGHVDSTFKGPVEPTGIPVNGLGHMLGELVHKVVWQLVLGQVSGDFDERHL